MKVKDGLIGLAVGDALGVPVEFTDRKRLSLKPVTMMQAYGVHNQPKGTWSDDSSLTFCLAEGLKNGYNLQAIATNFIKWKNEGWWTPHGQVFDIGFTTRAAIDKLQKGVHPVDAGGKGQDDNGNGSLMRILPLAFYLQSEEDQLQRFKVIQEVSSLTHAHIRSVIACKIYVDFAIELLNGLPKQEAYEKVKQRNRDVLVKLALPYQEVKTFDRILGNDIHAYFQAEIHSSGYVIHTLEASIWCLLNHSDFRTTVLAAVNLGEDTDTTGAVTGGLAGIVYGMDAIPEDWRNTLVRIGDILRLADEFEKNIQLRH